MSVGGGRGDCCLGVGWRHPIKTILVEMAGVLILYERRLAIVYFNQIESNLQGNSLKMNKKHLTILALFNLFPPFSCRRRSYPLKSETDKPIRFAVRSLGWVEIAEEDLTPERSSKAVNKCILDLSFGKNDLLDNIGRWGDVSWSEGV